jgi:ADP-ribose pyrophosphatase YjhB (NUDIX family)
VAADVTDRVRALLVTPDGGFLVFRRLRPGVDPYWILPGGGVEDGETLAAALERELREEIAATAEVHGLLYIFEGGGPDRHYIYLARARTWSADPADRTGPEFSDPACGEHLLQEIPLTARGVAGIDLKPEAFAGFLLRQLRSGTDLFTLPDLRQA